MADERSMKELIDCGESVFHCAEDMFTVLEEFNPGKLPEDFDYEELNIKGNQTNFRPCFETKDQR